MWGFFKRSLEVVEAECIKYIIIGTGIGAAVLSYLLSFIGWVGAFPWQVIVLLGIIGALALWFIVLALGFVWLLFQWTKLRVFGDPASSASATVSPVESSASKSEIDALRVRIESIGATHLKQSEALQQTVETVGEIHRIVEAICRRERFAELINVMQCRLSYCDERWKVFHEAAKTFNPKDVTRNEAYYRAAGEVGNCLSFRGIDAVSKILGIEPPKEANPRYSDDPMMNAQGEAEAPVEVRQAYRKNFDRHRHGQEQIERLICAMEEKARENEQIIRRGAGLDN